MSIRNLSAALAAATLVTAPVAAQAAPTRAAAPTTEANELGGTDLWIFGVIAAIVVLWAVLDSDDNDSVSA